MKKHACLLMVLILCLVTACGPQPTPTTEPCQGLPNPASQHCLDQGYHYEIRTESDGQTGYCQFPDGTECEEWAFFRGECSPGTQEPG